MSGESARHSDLCEAARAVEPLFYLRFKYIFDNNSCILERCCAKPDQLEKVFIDARQSLRRLVSESPTSIPVAVCGSFCSWFILLFGNPNRVQFFGCSCRQRDTPVGRMLVVRQHQLPNHQCRRLFQQSELAFDDALMHGLEICLLERWSPGLFICDVYKL